MTPPACMCDLASEREKTMSEPALEAILELFPPHTHTLTLVSDPDELLADAEGIATLRERGFQLLQGEDPIRLRLAVHQVRPFTAEWPVVVVTTSTLDSLPYDLWQQGRHITLSLDTCWPGLEVGCCVPSPPGSEDYLGTVPIEAQQRNCPRVRRRNSRSSASLASTLSRSLRV